MEKVSRRVSERFVLDESVAIRPSLTGRVTRKWSANRLSGSCRFPNSLLISSPASSAAGRNLTTGIPGTGTGKTLQPVRAARTAPADRNDAAPPQADDVDLPISLNGLSLFEEITLRSSILQHLFSVFISARAVEENACRRRQRHFVRDANPTAFIEVAAPTRRSSGSSLRHECDATRAPASSSAASGEQPTEQALDARSILISDYLSRRSRLKSRVRFRRLA